MTETTLPRTKHMPGWLNGIVRLLLTTPGVQRVVGRRVALLTFQGRFHDVTALLQCGDKLAIQRCIIFDDQDGRRVEGSAAPAPSTTAAAPIIAPGFFPMWASLLRPASLALARSPPSHIFSSTPSPRCSPPSHCGGTQPQRDRFRHDVRET